MKMWFEKLEDEAGYIKIFSCVEDTGCGIKPTDLVKLFSSFEQVDTKRNRSVEGTGLGLAISKRLCRSMGGDITVDSIYGKGSIFTWTIVNKVDNWQPMGKITKDASLVQRKLFQYTFTAEEASVLLVDDNRVNLKVAEGMMAPYKLKVTCVESGAEALNLMTTEKFDIVFADPPYALEDLATLPDKVFASDILHPDCWFILEHGDEHSFETHPHFIKEKKYSRVHFSFFQ